MFLPIAKRSRPVHRGSLAAALAALFVSMLPALVPQATAQEWPARPMRVVIPFAAGSVSEAIFRVMAPSVENRLGQRFVVESKPGADGHIGVGEVIRAPTPALNCFTPAVSCTAV